MNKRARLTRRILRDHRRGGVGHLNRERNRILGEVWVLWHCPHCRLLAPGVTYQGLM